MKKEEWKRLKISKKIIPGFLISSRGRIFNKNTQRLMKWHLNKSRSAYYWRVIINEKKYSLHLLVAENWVKKNRLYFDQVNHKDLNTLNPAAYNLEWTTQSRNIKHCWEHRKLIFNGKLHKLQRRK